jgi:hypothetical protein
MAEPAARPIQQNGIARRIVSLHAPSGRLDSGAPAFMRKLLEFEGGLLGSVPHRAVPTLKPMGTFDLKQTRAGLYA